MATVFEIVLPVGTPNAHLAATAALDEIDRLESQLTVYRDTSEVCAINREAARAPVPVEPQLFQLFLTAQQLTQETEGAFDISAGSLIKTWGFFNGPARIPQKSQRLQALERVGMQHVELNEAAITIQFHRPGLELNLGSIGKGYALDRAAELLRRDWNLTSALLHGGHSSVYAMGSPPGNPRGWSAGITHPWQRNRRLATLRLRDQALGTSASTFKHMNWGQKKLGHILDPRTGWPAEGMALTSVIAPNAAEADALATAYYILGPEKSRVHCQCRPRLGALLLPSGPGAEAQFVGACARPDGVGDGDSSLE
jgi:thiamine biosynthesis lipoprotein